jgi:RES domain-containing protein
VTPPQRQLVQEATHRLISSKHSEAGTVLAEIAEGQSMLDDLILLDGATNDRVQGELQGLIGIGPHELLFGIPGARIVNGAFGHASEEGGRFNDHTRGAWYAAFELDTSIAEVAYHKAKQLANIVVPEQPRRRPTGEVSTYDDWLADFRSEFHILEPVEPYADFLQAEPVPQCYTASQHLARVLLATKSNGLIYPSVRRAGATCLVCFRPALVGNPRRDLRLAVTFMDTDTGYQHQVRSVSF